MSKLYSLYLAWLLACFAMLGSLYFSEIRQLEPCHLCWYQRICIYPMTVILGIATYRHFFGIVAYVMPLAVIGFLIASYQVIIQEVPQWQPIELCGAGPSCLDKIDIGLGPITIPMLSCLNMALICLFLYRASPFKEFSSLNKRSSQNT